MRRIVRRLPRSSAATVMTAARWQMTGGTDAAAAAAVAASAGAGEAKTGDAATAGTTPAAAAGATAEVYRFPANEVMDAVKKRDFNAVQSHATRLVQSRWREEYNVPAACIIVFTVMWYWIAWTRRSVRRRCEATKASVHQQTEEMVEVVRSMTERWRGDMAKANTQMQGIIDKNSELTRDIDRLTTALRSCSIRPTPTAAFVAPTSSAGKRAAPVEEVAAAETVGDAGDAPAEAAEEAKE
ncbi:hypothetical protein NESM_000706900 [Novymonas esmeraldas]|uniref:Uncharacterized protein n=1 Tax=Novymonas esmeraldas TaxID=1808958 RepID=A0AAW0ETH3_9TRYP